MEILNVQGLCKTYGSGAAQVRALQNATFSLQRGEFAAIVGDSGSGKSTLLSCVGGLDTPTTGKVFLDGEDLFALPEERRTIFRRQNIGFIFQAFHLIPELNVEQNMVFPLLLDGQRPEQSRVDELLEVLGLADRRLHLPCELSGGQQQRAAIGRALITHPAVVLADEPTGNLDSKSGSEVMELLQNVWKKMGTKLVVITHDSRVAQMADRQFVIVDGVLSEVTAK